MMSKPHEEKVTLGNGKESAKKQDDHDGDPIEYYFFSATSKFVANAETQDGKPIVFSFISSTRDANEIGHRDKELVWVGRKSQLKNIRYVSRPASPSRYYRNHSLYVSETLQGLTKSWS